MFGSILAIGRGAFFSSRSQSVAGAAIWWEVLWDPACFCAWAKIEGGIFVLLKRGGNAEESMASIRWLKGASVQDASTARTIQIIRSEHRDSGTLAAAIENQQLMFDQQ